jgi:hypothetical protein
MRTCSLAFAALVVAGLVALEPAVLVGQAPRAASGKAYSPPRTADGHPDLSGMWDVTTVTPVERPPNMPLVITEEQARQQEQGAVTRIENASRPSDPNRPAPRLGANVGTYNNFWVDSGTSVIVVDGQRRSSLVIDPPDGRVPPMTAEAKLRNSKLRGTAAPTADTLENAAPTAVGDYDGHEVRPLAERCLIGFGSTSGPPSLPNYGYNNLKQIVQTKDYVMILNEMVHDLRIIRMNQPHLPASQRRWLGDSVGRWEGDTLVVETTNFTDKTRFRGSSQNLKVTERFTRVAADAILYKFTIEDPATWTQPWTGEFPWRATQSQLYEYACHEGNHSFGGIMRGARLLENEAAAKPKPAR